MFNGPSPALGNRRAKCTMETFLLFQGTEMEQKIIWVDGLTSFCILLRKGKTLTASTAKGMKNCLITFLQVTCMR